MNIDIHSTPFEAMLQDLNKEIVRVIDKVYRGEFETGEINLKLSLTLFEDYKEFPVEDETGQTSNETYEYKRPVFEHNITSMLKKQYKQKGFYTEEKRSHA